MGGPQDHVCPHRLSCYKTRGSRYKDGNADNQLLQQSCFTHGGPPISMQQGLPSRQPRSLDANLHPKPRQLCGWPMVPFEMTTFLDQTCIALSTTCGPHVDLAEYSRVVRGTESANTP